MKAQNSKFQSQKIDLLLINEISKPSQISKIQAPSNMLQLHNLLKFKNAKSGRSKQQKQNAQNWLNKEGIDISPLIQRVKKAKEISMQKQQMKKIEQDCIFYIPDMSSKKLDQYLQISHAYNKMNIVQKSIQKKDFSKKIMGKSQSKFGYITTSSKSSNQLGKQRSLGLITSIKTQTRDQQKRQKYLKCITSLAKKAISKDDLVHQISNSLNKKLWRIFSKHVKILNQNKKMNQNQPFTQLYLESLRQVQQQYDYILPKSAQSLNHYLTTNYLQKLQKRQQKFIRDRQHQSFWGKAFLLYRAGRKRQFYHLLGNRNQTELMKYFKQIDQSIDQRNPYVISNDIQSSYDTDVFKSQLVYALKGEAKYSSEVLSDPFTLDFVWILLRNLGIFYRKLKSQFQGYKSKVIEAYQKQGFCSEQQFYNYFYLLAYRQIAELGLTDIMDQDDYVHFLICLSLNLQLLQDKNFDRLQTLLTKQLMNYIRQLISLGRSQYVYYMALLPKKDRVTQISTLLSSSNLISTFDWEFLKNNIPTKQQFQSLVKNTLNKYILTTDDYLTAADRYVELLQQNEEAIRCLLQLLIKNLYNDSYKSDIVYQAQASCDRYLCKNSSLQTQYRDVFIFLVDSRKLLQLLKERRDVEIFNFVKNNDFIILGGTIPARNHQFFENIISLSGLGMDVYFKFLKFVVKGLEIYYLRQNKNLELSQFMTLLEQNVEFILSFQKYKNCKNKDQAISLIDLINSSNYQIKNKMT